MGESLGLAWACLRRIKRDEPQANTQDNLESPSIQRLCFNIAQISRQISIPTNALGFKTTNYCCRRRLLYSSDLVSIAVWSDCVSILRPLEESLDLSDSSASEWTSSYYDTPVLYCTVCMAQ